MGIYILILVACFFVVGTLVGRHYFGKDALFLVAVGCAIGANIYSSGTTPVIVGNLVFGIDAIIYTMFVFAIILTLIDYGYKDAINMLVCTCVAIMISAFITFFANWASVGIEAGVVWGLISYSLSTIGTFVAVFIGIKIFQVLEKGHTNKYLSLTVCIVVASILNSIVYFGGLALFEGAVANSLIKMLLGSYIGKFATIALTIIGLLFFNFLFNRENMKGKNELNTDINNK